MQNQKPTRVPSYRRHRPSGQAVVTLDGRDFYLGRWNTQASRVEYDRHITEWLAAGRRLTPEAEDVDLTITELIAHYIRFAKGYYRKNGILTDEVAGIRAALRPLKRLYGQHDTKNFGPLALKAVRQSLIDGAKSRKYINDCINRIKRMFRWAVENELARASVLHGLQAVQGLRRGRSDAYEPEPVGPVPDEIVDATLPHVSPVVAAMIRLQRLTGMRSGELVILRGCDLDMSGRIWIYRPSSHKTEHHGHQRTICLGPQAQGVIGPFLKPDLSGYLFSPQHSEVQRRAARSMLRKTPLSYGNGPGTNRKRIPKCKAGEHYSPDSYRRAVARACEKAFPAPTDLSGEEIAHWQKERRWHPHQLRHNAATRIRKEFGLDAARTVLGHRSAAITDMYAEVDQTKAAEIMGRVG